MANNEKGRQVIMLSQPPNDKPKYIHSITVCIQHLKHVTSTFLQIVADCF